MHAPANRSLFACCLFALAACSSHSPSHALGDASSGSGSGSGSGDHGGPTILELATNTSLMTGSDQLVVSAVVTDSAGIEQVIGGTLADMSGGTYGTFEVSTTSGAWSLTLTWNAIETVSGITAGVGGEARMFVATFYDQAGHTNSKSVVVRLSCGATDTVDSLCAGTCLDLSTNAANCGACGTTCVFGGGCAAGHCAAMTTCIAGPGTTCDEYCASLGGTCGAVCGNSVAGLQFVDATCDTGGDAITSCMESLAQVQGYSCCCTQ